MKELKTTRREFTKILVGSAGIPMPTFALAADARAGGQRIVIPLDGEWDIEEGVEPELAPTNFGPHGSRAGTRALGEALVPGG